MRISNLQIFTFFTLTQIFKIFTHHFLKSIKSPTNVLNNLKNTIVSYREF